MRALMPPLRGFRVLMKWRAISIRTRAGWFGFFTDFFFTDAFDTVLLTFRLEG